MLRELNLKAVYRSESDNILKEFYIPALSTSVKYDRAVGFFSASMLSYAAQGLSAFINNGGQMRLIIGGALEPEDEQAMREGYELRILVEKFGQHIIHTIENTNDSIFYRRMELLSWLVASGSLEIKIAFRKKGMYHEKIGILTDAEGDKVVFQGAANETASALLPDYNFESINVFQCWRNEFQDHFMPYIVGFEKLWNNKSPNTLVLNFPDAAKEKLISIAKRGAKIISPNVEIELWNKYYNIENDIEEEDKNPRIPSIFNGEEFAIRAHQQKALNIWKSKEWRGIFAHATGSGKTITAIYGAIRIYEAFKKLFLIIAVPYQNLADQWVGILKDFNIRPIRCYENVSQWSSSLSEYITLYQTGSLSFVCVVVVNRTLQSENFQNLLKQIPGDNLLWIADECHHHGTQSLAMSLPQQANLRLGLSATPKHYINKEANDRLTDYYGSVIDSYGLEQALKDGVLTPYKYYVVPINLTEDEAEEYRQLSEQISHLAAMRNGESSHQPDDEMLNMLLFRRARLLGRAQNKLLELGSMLKNEKPTPYTLFYCGDGNTEDKESGDIIRQVEAVTQILYQHGWKCSLFTSRENREERSRILDHFRVGLVDALVAIRCLDEGIDVPACRKAYILASGRNPRQFIQRRGRILRRSLGKDYAEIYDFFVTIPPEIAEGSPYEAQLIRAELERVAEFTRLSLNESDAIKTLLPVLKQYNLAHVLV
jgi:superfamily II DNA or RNA helicase